MTKETEQFSDNVLSEITKFQSNPAFSSMSNKAVAIHIENIIYEERVKIRKKSLNIQP